MTTPNAGLEGLVGLLPWHWTHVGLVHDVTDDRYVVDDFGTATAIPFSFDLNELQEH